MKIVFLGPPGAGKGTQAMVISRELGIPHISTGDIFRQNIKNETPLGVAAKKFIDEGRLVPDDLTLDLVNDRLAAADCKNGYLLDGFPRTLPQAEALDEKVALDYAVNVDVAHDHLIDRLSGRRVCPECGASYHVTTLDGSEECAVCGNLLIQRDDDKPETIRKRLEVYEAQTRALIDFYRDKGILVDIDGARSVEEVRADILAALGSDAK